mmetsp:Transcript_13151/g.22261  ORF Transcript_13151/g.22261 Transcript_13151/m.22261 type:complete len:182 (-) Transcript_13151:640-1185(-)
MEERNLRSLHNKVNSLSNFKDRHQSHNRLGQARLMRGDEGGENGNLQLNIQNQKYLSIVYELVKQEHVWKLLKWINSLSEQNKKGLRVLKTIIDIRGNKRFKPLQGGSQKIDALLEEDIFTLHARNFESTAAKDLFRKMTQKTSYRTQFGEPPKATEDYVIMKQKNFRQLEISKYIQELPA